LGYFLATFCDHFLASFGEQFGYKIFLHLATLINIDILLIDSQCILLQEKVVLAVSQVL